MSDERFWRKVDKSGVCWVWTGARQGNGYGQLTRDRAHHLAHRFSWAMHHGAIPGGVDVCHKCDNPSCVRPDHLFLGSRLDNMQDAMKKGRIPGGERHYAALLDDDRVREIRRRLAAGEGPAAVGRAMGLEMKHVSLVGRGKRWKHVQ